jgi:hypothetical protein
MIADLNFVVYVKFSSKPLHGRCTTALDSKQGGEGGRTKMYPIYYNLFTYVYVSTS